MKKKSQAAPAALPSWRDNLRTYQVADAEWLTDLAPGMRAKILANDPGFGKTREGLAAHRRRIEEGLTEAGAMLTLTTAISKKDWVREAQKYWPGLPIGVIGEFKKKAKRKLKAKAGESGEQLAARQALHNEEVEAAREAAEQGHNRQLIDMLRAGKSEPCLIIGSHESAERLHELVFGPEDILLNYTFVDEAHVMKKEASKANKLIRPLIGRSEISTLSTATPIHNRCEDLHQLLDLCALNKFGSKWTFAKKYFHIHTSEYQMRQVIGDVKEKELLAAAIAPFVMKRTQEEAYGELPACIYEMKLVDAGNVPLLSREAIRARSKQGGFLDTTLREVAQHKLDSVIDYAIELDEPVVIYTFERGHARYVCNKLNQKRFSASLATGDSSPEARDKIIEAWKVGSTKALVCTMDAVRESATLTRASVMLLADFDWLPGKMIQVMGRIHPSRQPEDNRRPARYFFFAMDGGADQVVAERVIEKIVAQEGVITMQSSMTELKGALSFLSKKVPDESPADVLADLIGRIEARESRLSSVGAVMELSF